MCVGGLRLMILERIPRFKLDWVKEDVMRLLTLSWFGKKKKRWKIKELSKTIPLKILPIFNLSINKMPTYMLHICQKKKKKSLETRKLDPCFLSLLSEKKSLKNNS